MRPRLAVLLMCLPLASVACGDDGGSIFDEAPPATVRPADTITLAAAGDTWELPAAVCLRDDGDAEVVLAAAQEQAAEVRSLVGHLVSGWPTTTYALDFDHEGYERDLRAAAVSALALAGVIGEQAGLEQAWEEWEQAHADPDGGWGPPDEIARRLAGWEAEAEILAGAVAAHCAG